MAASEWLDENNLTWLQSPPKIKLLPVTDARQPYPLSWDEQARLFQELPPHLARMALFKVNTGTRESEVCDLRWEWEVPVPELDASVFIIPADRVKNGDERLVVLNRVAWSVVDEVRGEHSDVRVHLPGALGPRHEQHRLAEREETRGPPSGTRSRSEAHLRTSLTSGRSELRGSPGLAGTQVGTDYDALLGGGAAESDRRGEPGVREDSRKSPALVLLKQKAAKANAITA